MPSRERVPFTATWISHGLLDDQTRWQTSWTLYLPEATGFDQSSVHELHERLVTWSEPFWSVYLPNGAVSSLYRLVVEGPASVVVDEAFGFANGSAGDPVPAAVSVPVIQKVQAFGRGRNGRFWLPAPPAASVSFSWQLSAPARAALSLQLANFFNGVQAIVTSGFPHVYFAVINRQRAGVVVSPPLVQLVDTWVTAKRLGTQDRRMSHPIPA